MLSVSISPDTTRDIARTIGVHPDVAEWLVPAAAVLLGYLSGYAIELLVGRFLPRIAGRTRTKFDDVLATALRGPVKLFSTLIGVAVAILLTPTPQVVRDVADRLLLVLAILAGIVVAARTFGGVVLTYGERAHLVGSTRSAVKRIVTLTIYVVGILFILDNQGVEITPLLTTLGLAGLALALALQDTLGNFFAGIYVQADKPLEVGHYVRLEDLSIEGFVEEVGWRTTKIRTLPNNIVVIPNSRVASSVVTDYDLPEPRMSLLVNVHVTRAADPRVVERLLVEEATKAAGEIPGILREPAPFVRFIPGFTENGLGFTLITQVEKFVDQFLAQHELRYRVLDRLRREGIELAYPVRVLRSEDGVSLVPEAAGAAEGRRASP